MKRTEFRRGRQACGIERLSTEIDVNFFHLTGEHAADEGGDFLVLLEGRLDRFHGSFDLGGFLSRFNEEPDFLTQGIEELDLVIEQFGSPHQPVAGADLQRFEGAGGLQRFDPFIGITVAHVVVRTVHTSVAGEENALLWQPGESVTAGVGDSEMDQFDLVTPVFEFQLLGEDEAGGNQRHHGGEQQHIENFLDCIRTGKTPNSEIEEGQKSTLLCHLGNISYKLGRMVKFDPVTKKIVGDKDAEALWGREYRKGWEPVV